MRVCGVATFWCLSIACAAGRNASASWQLVWSDDFNGPRLDSTKWIAACYHNNANAELEYYTPDEVYISCAAGLNSTTEQLLHPLHTAGSSCTVANSDAWATGVHIDCCEGLAEKNIDGKIICVAPACTTVGHDTWVTGGHVQCCSGLTETNKNGKLLCDASCTAQGKDAYGTGAHVACCSGLVEQNEDGKIICEALTCCTVAGHESSETGSHVPCCTGLSEQNESGKLVCETAVCTPNGSDSYGSGSHVPCCSGLSEKNEAGKLICRPGTDCNLVLRTQRRQLSGWPYTSGKIQSKFSTTYGKFEMRAKLPGGSGMWPAFWMMPTAGDCWPKSGEIDIMELQGFNPWTTHANLIHGYSCNAPIDDVGFQDSSTGQSLSEAFHVYTLEWEAGAMRWYLDGDLFHTVNHDVPAQDYYIILNTAVGSGGFSGAVSSSTPFPNYSTIDYVKVWKSV